MPYYVQCLYNGVGFPAEKFTNQKEVDEYFKIMDDFLNVSLEDGYVEQFVNRLKSELLIMEDALWKASLSTQDIKEFEKIVEEHCKNDFPSSYEWLNIRWCINIHCLLKLKRISKNKMNCINVWKIKK